MLPTDPLPLPPVESLTSKQITLLLAETCGWWFDPALGCWQEPREGSAARSVTPADVLEGLPANVPDFTGDLNLLRPLVAALDAIEGREFLAALELLVAIRTGSKDPLRVANATALDRAQALIVAAGRALIDRPVPPEAGRCEGAPESALARSPAPRGARIPDGQADGVRADGGQR